MFMTLPVGFLPRVWPGIITGANSWMITTRGGVDGEPSDVGPAMNSLVWFANSF